MNKVYIQIGLRDFTNNLSSWSNVTAYYQFFGTTVTQMGTTVIETVGTLSPVITISIDNFQIIVFMAGVGVVLNVKSSTLLETIQFPS
jgi:hypothetical protein